MEDIVWTAIKIASALVCFLILSTIWEKVRNAIGARSGIGGFYNKLPRPNFDDGDFGDGQLISNIERLGDFLLDRSIEHGSANSSSSDWQWRLGTDLKQIANIARNSEEPF